MKFWTLKNEEFARPLLDQLAEYSDNFNNFIPAFLKIFPYNNRIISLVVRLIISGK